MKLPYDCFLTPLLVFLPKLFEMPKFKIKTFKNTQKQEIPTIKTVNKHKQ